MGRTEWLQPTKQHGKHIQQTDQVDTLGIWSRPSWYARHTKQTARPLISWRTDKCNQTAPAFSSTTWRPRGRETGSPQEKKWGKTKGNTTKKKNRCVGAKGQQPPKTNAHEWLDVCQWLRYLSFRFVDYDEFKMWDWASFGTRLVLKTGFMWNKWKLLGNIPHFLYNGEDYLLAFLTPSYIFLS